jgi:hypothetical protein
MSQIFKNGKNNYFYNNIKINVNKDNMSFLCNFNENVI